MSKIALEKELTVKELVFTIKNRLESEFINISVKGEVSNFSSSQAGHYYFNISDEEASISCAVFRADALRNADLKKLKDGDKVSCFGSVSVYAKRGQFQLIVKRIEPVGKGNLLEQFEQLKKKLASEGLFSPEHKKKIPKFPKKVAIITAEQGAALQDFLNIYNRRSVAMNVLLVPALVQGRDSAQSLVQGLHRCIEFNMHADTENKIDVVVLARGGGAMEDLWSFNDEALAYEIFNCPIPVVSAVGHQVDFTIADFVSDFRAETPSAAAEMLTEFQTGLLLHLEKARRSLSKQMSHLMQEKSIALNSINPYASVEKIIMGVFRLKERFLALKFLGRENQLLRIDEKKLELDEYNERLIQSGNERLEKLKQNLERLFELLNSLNPKNILTRGYSYVTNEEGHCVGNIKEFDKLSEGSEMTLHFSDGDGKVIKRRNQ